MPLPVLNWSEKNSGCVSANRDFRYAKLENGYKIILNVYYAHMIIELVRDLKAKNVIATFKKMIWESYERESANGACLPCRLLRQICTCTK